MTTFRYTEARGSGQSARRPQTEDNLRKQFLEYTGLRRDVFANPVAEQEYGFSSRPDALVHKSPDEERRAADVDRKEREEWIRNLFPNLYIEPDANDPARTVSVNGGVKIRETPQPTKTPPEATHEPTTNTTPPSPKPLEPIFSPRSFFVDPLYATRSQGSIFKDLRRPMHTFLFGQPGEGKTTTRLALEAHVRAQPERTLIVTYEPGRADVSPTLDDHYRRLVEAMAVDLFVQVVEQFAYRRRKPGGRQTAGMVWLLSLAGPAMIRVLDLLVHGKEPSHIWGYAELWHFLDRPVVRPVVRTERLRVWLRDVQARLEGLKERPLALPSAYKAWRRALTIARQWGFRQIFVAVDGVDTWQRTEEQMMVLVAPLLRVADGLARRSVWLKGFLPLALREPVAAALRRLPPDQWQSLVLSWEKERLAAMLYARFRAAESARLGLSDLAEPSLKKTFDESLLDKAHGSPRRLLTIIDQLINIHIGRGPSGRPVTEEEWQKAQKQTVELLGAGV